VGLNLAETHASISCVSSARRSPATSERNQVH
jgi:hypothetical protein